MPTITAITTNSATLGHTVTDDGGLSITARGIVLAQTSDNADPTLGGSLVTNLTTNGTTGVFSVNAAGLQTGRTYSFAAYATNSLGTTYTSVETFSTLAILGSTSFLEGPAAGSDFDLIVAAGPWTVTSNASWLHSTSGGIGNGNFSFTFDANTGANAHRHDHHLRRDRDHHSSRKQLCRRQSGDYARSLRSGCGIWVGGGRQRQRLHPGLQ